MQLTLKSAKPLLFSASGLVFLVAFFLLGSSLAPTDTHAEVFTIVGATGYYLNTTSSTDSRVDLSISSTPDGAMKMTKETLTTKTNSPQGYQLYIGMTGDTNVLYRDEDSETGLAATSGTYSEPATLGTNTWGYAVPRNGNTSLESNNKFTTGTYIDGGSDQTSLWASVPAHGAEQLVQKTSAGDESGTDLNVYYAAKINSSLAPGAYKGTVVYTAVTLANSAHVASVSPSVLDSLTGGDELTITVGISTPAASISSSSVLVGAESCPVTTIANNQDGTLALTCTAPAQSLSGRYDVAIDLDAYGKFYIANGVEYQTSGGGGGGGGLYVTPTTFAAGFSSQIQIYLPLLTNTVSSFSLSSVQIGSDTCTSPSADSSGDIYIITCNTPSTLTSGEHTIAVSATVDGTTTTFTDTVPFTALNTMQVFTSAQCTAMSTGQTILLADARDGKEYRVRKLKDGKCWMIDNLRLGEAGKALTLKASDSDITGSDKTIPAANIVNSGSTSWTYDEYRIYVRDDASFTEDSDNYGTYYNVSGNDYGNLYTWYTATAGTGTKSMSQGAIAGQSICPKGWILPQNAEGTGSFKTLYNSYNSQSLMTTVAAKNSTVANRGPEFKLAGYYNGGVNNVGSDGGYWSRTAYGQYGSRYGAYRLSLNTSSVNPQSYDYQYAGNSVRCIAS